MRSSGRQAPAGVGVVVVGRKRGAVPAGLIDRMAVPDFCLAPALQALVHREHLTEAVVLSTCLRTEIYVAASSAHGALSDVRSFLREWVPGEPEPDDDDLYSFCGEEAVSHLFRVASGIDSAILGEGEILRQVRKAWKLAEREDAAGRVLTPLFRHSLEVGKRARSETAISRGTTSFSQAAVAMAEEHFGGLQGRSVLVVGAGAMGRGVSRALTSVPRIGDVMFANRTSSRASALAEQLGGQPVEMNRLTGAIERADLLVTSTAATNVLVSQADVRATLPARSGRPLLVVDMAVPRDVDPAVGDLPSVTLKNMDDLKAFSELGMSGRRKEIHAVSRIVDDEVRRFLELAAQRETAPLVAALHQRAEHLRQAELTRYRTQLANLDEGEWAAVEALSRGLLAKLLHEPSVQIKEAAGSPQQDQFLEAVRTLFALDGNRNDQVWSSQSLGSAERA
jgi:glutamyl-tRNA reductase